MGEVSSVLALSRVNCSASVLAKVLENEGFMVQYAHVRGCCTALLLFIFLLI